MNHALVKMALSGRGIAGSTTVIELVPAVFGAPPVEIPLS
jgi:hypothetical protein